MLATYRDQENLAHSRQIQSKQQPKTPGTKYPKPVFGAGKNDENLSTAFAGKGHLTATTRRTEYDKLDARCNGDQAVLMTPLDKRTRAPLGNKTTNAKAKSNVRQAAVMKDIVQETEKSRTKPMTNRNSKLATSRATNVTVVQSNPNEDTDEEQPEYAPSNPQPLPYESDILPPGGLTFDGLKQENLMKGYYYAFINPIDEHGVSQTDRKFQEEMDLVARRAMTCNEKNLENITWIEADGVSKSKMSRKTADPQSSQSSGEPQSRNALTLRQTSTVTSKRAASALAMRPKKERTKDFKIIANKPATRNTLLPAVYRDRPVASKLPNLPVCQGTTVGEAASRTTIGYNKGKITSSVMNAVKTDQARTTLATQKHGQSSTILKSTSDATEATLLPARMKQLLQEQEMPGSEERVTQLMSLFYDRDDEDLPLNCSPLSVLGIEDDDGEFELKFEA